MTPFPPVSIVGFAACTSLGYSLESTLAAIGAGLSNFTNTTVPNEFGHPAVAASLVDPDAPRGERLALLIHHGIDDARALLAPHGLQGIPALVGVPSDLTVDEQEMVLAALREDPTLIAEVAWYRHGRASTFIALAAAKEMIMRRTHRVALVVGVDSLCARATVSSLVRAGRLLSPFTEGTIPGEAAALALLAGSNDPIVDPSTAVGLEAVALARAAIPFTRAQMVSADALTTVFRALREHGATRVDRVVAAHSGEGYFGRSFAHAYLREIDIMPEPLTVELIADCVGDVGAAAGILGLAFGTYSIVEDGRDREGRALAYSESDTGEVGAAIIDGAPTSWQRGAVLHRAHLRG